MINKTLRSYCFRTGEEFQAVTVAMHKATEDGVFQLRKCTEEQLQKRYAWVKEYLQ